MAYDIITIPSENFNARSKTPIQLIITHCIGLPLDKTLKAFAYKDADQGGLGVAPHYLIPQITAQTFIDQFSDLYNLGEIILKYPQNVPAIQFVKEEDRAWHAGISSLDKFNDLPGCGIGLNSCSIGIEFHAPGYEESQDCFKFASFTATQITTGAHLMVDICKRQNLDQRHIWGHSDISPWRPTSSSSSTKIKTDPGPFFPWAELYQKYSLGIWPTSNSTPPQIEKSEEQAYVKTRLTALGYKMSPGSEWTELDRHVINAFRMHFMQDTYKLIYPKDENFGGIDAELINFLGQNFNR
ncbi:MAG: N-acetylmuramoyl-L-alanine amidase [Candidatus Paracaedibacteraceae bacterium]|nr:N-acetylmuramoyl-L-alanine amidase [Candidatus Paracaedibacteraceae bacterium]